MMRLNEESDPMRDEPEAEIRFQREINLKSAAVGEGIPLVNDLAECGRWSSGGAAVAGARNQRIIHRDLKPGNIMIAKSGVKVLDFGLAKSGADETVTSSQMVMGTPAYMAPEQREGKPADARTDIYV